MPSETTIVLVGLAICVGAVVVLFRLTARLAAPPLARSAASLDALLAETEKFCHSVPLPGDLCRQRSEYLQSLQTNFDAVCAAVKVVQTQSPIDRPDLARALVRNQVTFACRMMAARLRLAVYRFGVGGS